MRSCLLAVLFLALAAAYACGGDDGNGSSAGTPTEDPDRTGRPIRPGQLPEEYPEDFPAFENASFQQSFKYENQIFVTLSSTESAETVADFYREALDEAPWTFLSEVDAPGPDLLVLSFEHVEDPVTGSVTLSPGPGEGTTIISVRLISPDFISATEAAPTSTATPDAESS